MMSTFTCNLLLYQIYSIASLIVTLTAILLSPLLALFVDGDGNLPHYLRWFQTPDNPCWGDEPFRINETPNDSTYIRTVKWLVRNPAQGFDMVVGGTQSPDTTYKVYGKFVTEGNDEGIVSKPGIGGVLLVTSDKYFHLYIIIPFGSHCIHSEFGWMLRSSVETKIIHPKVSFVFTPIRFFNFVR